MGKRHIPESSAAHPNVTPLIDVVMVLIVFFMLVAKIGVTSGAEKMDIPVSIQGVDIQDLGNTLLLNVTAGQADQPFITALVRGTKQELKVFDTTSKRNQLVDVLKYFRDGDKAAGIPANEQFKVIIRGDSEMAYKFLEPVLLACAEARVKEVAFNTKKATEEVTE